MAATTIRDVAKQAGVGVGTVSRVLNDSPSVSEITRRKVLVAIEELNFAPNPFARRLSLGKTMTIGVIVPFFTRPAFVERLRGIEYALVNSEYDLVLYNVETVERRDAYFREMPRRERVDGLLIMALSPQDEDVERFIASGVTTVLVDAYHERLHSVTIDDVNGGYAATRHLIELGHGRIGYISDTMDNPFVFTASRRRYEGYRRALADAGISHRPEYHQQGAHGRRQAQQMAEQLLALPIPPTAIFAASDTQAIGVMQAAESMGLRVPQDLSIIGYDDIEIAEYLSLTTIRQPLFMTGIESVELLLSVIAQMPAKPTHLQLSTELIVRATTAAPRHRA